MRRLNITRSAVALAAAALIAGCGASTPVGDADVRARSAAYLALLGEGAFAAAYAEQAREARAGISEADFARMMSGAPDWFGGRAPRFSGVFWNHRYGFGEAGSFATVYFATARPELGELCGRLVWKREDAGFALFDIRVKAWRAEDLAALTPGGRAAVKRGAGCHLVPPAEAAEAAAPRRG